MNEQLVELKPEVKTAMQQLQEFVAHLTVETVEDEEAALMMRKRATDALEAAEAWFSPFVKSAHQTWSRLTSAREVVRDTFRGVIKTIDEAVCARREKARAAAEREQARLTALARDVSEREKQKLEERAMKAEARGAHALAESLRETAQKIMPVVPTVAPDISESKIVHERRTWKCELISLDELVQAAAKDKSFQAYLIFNQSAADGVVRSSRGSVVPPGCKAVQVTSLAKARSI